MPIPAERSLAKAAGHVTFFTGRPCKNGHIAHRYTAGGGCSVCASERQKSAPRSAVDPIKNAVYQAKWNASTRGYQAKMAWKVRDPKNAWACSAVGGAKARARKYGIPFDLDKEYVRAILTDTCPVLGTPFVWFGQKLGPHSPSLDRNDPSKGYVRGNVTVISARANAIKSDACIDEIEAVARWLREKDPK